MRARDRQTFAGLLTPIGAGGISIIELSGPESGAILERLLRSPSQCRVSEASPGELVYGKLVHNGRLLDEVIVEIADPESGRALIINCHGGTIAARRVLNALAAEGAREIEAAKLLRLKESSGALSTVQREALELLPRAPTLRVAALLLAQYHGALERAVESVRNLLLHEGDIARAESAISRLLSAAMFGRGLFHPPRVVVAGRPNVGKSTLMNALLRFERVIVHRVPGTTRDAVEDLFALHGVPFRLVDTAGIRRAENDVEREGVARGVLEIARADILLLTFDGSMPLQAEDEKLIARPMPEKVIPVINKRDLPRQLAAETLTRLLSRQPLLVSATQQLGIRELEDRILRSAYETLPAENEAVPFTPRQAKLLALASTALRRRERVHAASLLQRL